MTPLPRSSRRFNRSYSSLESLQDTVGWLCSYLARAGGLWVAFTISTINLPLWFTAVLAMWFALALTIEFTTVVYHRQNWELLPRQLLRERYPVFCTLSGWVILKQSGPGQLCSVAHPGKNVALDLNWTELVRVEDKRILKEIGAKSSLKGKEAVSGDMMGSYPGNAPDIL